MNNLYNIRGPLTRQVLKSYDGTFARYSEWINNHSEAEARYCGYYPSADGHIECYSDRSRVEIDSNTTIEQLKGRVFKIFNQNPKEKEVEIFMQSFKSGMGNNFENVEKEYVKNKNFDVTRFKEDFTKFKSSYLACRFVPIGTKAEEDKIINKISSLFWNTVEKVKDTYKKLTEKK